MGPSLEVARHAVLARYALAAEGLHWQALGDEGGFSGSEVWRGDDAAGRPVLALKAWPPTMSAERLAQIHAWMRQAAHLAFVPTVVVARGQQTVVVEAGRAWDLTQWMPGTADFRSHPTEGRLAAACAAVAQLHRAWRHGGSAPVRCPAVDRRLTVLRAWATRPSLAPYADTPIGDLLRRGCESVDRLVGPAERSLHQWAQWPVAVGPCLCDVWHDHILFTGEAVTGVIDFGAMKVDWVGVDLARLLGDLVGDDEPAFLAGLAAYRAAGGADLSATFVRALDRIGALCAVMGWILRLGSEARPGAVPKRVVLRVSQLIARLNSFPPMHLTIHSPH